MKNTIIPFIILSIISSCLAQTSSVKKKFCVAIFEKIFAEQVYYRNKEEYIPITVRRSQRSQDYYVNGDHDLELYYQKTNEEGKITYQLIGKKAFNSTFKKTLFLIDKAKGRPEKLPLRIFAFDDDKASFPMGSFKFANLTGSILHIGFNRSKKTLKPLGSTTLFARKSEKGGFTPMSIFDQQGNQVYSSSMFSQNLSREFIFIYPPANGRTRPLLKYLYDSIPKKIDDGQTP